MNQNSQHQYQWKQKTSAERPMTELSSLPNFPTEEVLPPYLSREIEFSRRLTVQKQQNQTDSWEEWDGFVLSQKIQGSVQHFFEQYLKQSGIKIQFLTQLNRESTYGLSGTPFVGNRTTNTAEILYPDPENLVVENGEVRELSQPRIILTKNRIEELLNKRYFLSENTQEEMGTRFSEAMISVVHELLHALIRKTDCGIIPLRNNVSTIRKNESLVHLLVEVLQLQVKLSYLKKGSNSQNSQDVNTEGVMQQLEKKILKIESDYESNCLNVLLENSFYSIHLRLNEQNYLLQQHKKSSIKSSFDKQSFIESENVKSTIDLILKKLKDDGIFPYIDVLQQCNHHIWYTPESSPSCGGYELLGSIVAETFTFPSSKTFLSDFPKNYNKKVKELYDQGKIGYNSLGFDFPNPLEIEDPTGRIYCPQDIVMIVLSKTMLDFKDFLSGNLLSPGKLEIQAKNLDEIPKHIDQAGTLIHELFHAFQAFTGSGLPKRWEFYSTPPGSGNINEIICYCIHHMIYQYYRTPTPDMKMLNWFGGVFVATGGESCIQFFMPKPKTRPKSPIPPNVPFWIPSSDYKNNPWRNWELFPSSSYTISIPTTMGSEPVVQIVKEFIFLLDGIDFIDKTVFIRLLELITFRKISSFSKDYLEHNLERTTNYIKPIYISLINSTDIYKFSIQYEVLAENVLKTGDFFTNDGKFLNTITTELLYSLVFLELFVNWSKYKPEKSTLYYPWDYDKNTEPYRSSYNIENLAIWITNWLRIRIETKLLGLSLPLILDEKKSYEAYYNGGIFILLYPYYKSKSPLPFEKTNSSKNFEATFKYEPFVDEVYSTALINLSHS